MTVVDRECRVARSRMQARLDLTVGDSQTLQAHLQVCPKCAAIQDAYSEVDRRIQQSLDSVRLHESVRATVLRRLEQEAERRRPRGPKRFRRRLLVRGASCILAAAAAATALFIPALPTDRAGERVTSLRAAFRVVRYRIGFPVAADRAHAGHLLAGAWDRVYESWNGGDSWSRLAPLPSGHVVRALAIDASEPGHYLVATKHSVFASGDGGRHWSMRIGSLPGAENMFLLQDVRNPSVFYLGPSVLWKSSDHGNSWSSAGRGAVFAPDGIQALTQAPDGTLISGIWAGGVARSRDGGVSWQRRDRGLRRNVMDVAGTSSANLWAATDLGLYHSDDGGGTWRKAGPSDRFFETSVLSGSGWLLAGGNGGLYRSTDGGRHWELAMAGLPLDPYVAGLTLDPHRHDRVYASLNMDGLFRSDDAGRHWTPIDNGLQVNGETPNSRAVLFRRSGALWITDASGSDPGLLTVDQNVRLAALSPDGAAVAYVAGDTRGWALRVLAAGGSEARTLAFGHGATPRQLQWSPNASALAFAAPSSLSVVGLDGARSGLAMKRSDALLGWSSDGRLLLFWRRSVGDVMATSWPLTRPARIVSYRARYQTQPTPTRSATRYAFVWHGGLYVAAGPGQPATVARVAPGCSVRSWSDDGDRLLLACRAGIEMRTSGGSLLARLGMSGLPAWAPGSRDTVLVFRNGSLWRWQPGEAPVRLVRDAQPITSPLR